MLLQKVLTMYKSIVHQFFRERTKFFTPSNPILDDSYTLSVITGKKCNILNEVCKHLVMVSYRNFWVGCVCVCVCVGGGGGICKYL